MASSNKVDIEIVAHSTAGPVIQGVASDVGAIAPAAGKAQAASDVALDSMRKRGVKASEAARSISEQLALIQRAYVGLQATQGMQAIAADLATTADAYNNLTARIKLTTGEGAVFTNAFEQISAIALRTNSNLESTGNLFAKLAEAGKSAGLGTQDAIAQALALAETVNQAVQLSGASATASDAAITQLIQGLQGGVLRGDEFNSVMEQSPRLAKALADGLGTTTGALRKMAEAGQLSADTVIKALQGQADTVAGEFSKLPPTVGRALQNLSTSWTLYVGETDKATGASKAAASVISALANSLSTIAGYLIDAGQAAAAFAALRLAQHFTGIATAATASATGIAANTAAMTAAGAAGTSAAVGVGRLAGLLGALKTFTLLGLVTNFHDIGTAIGEGAAKLMGFKDRTKELEAADKSAAQAAEESAAARRKQAAATKDAQDRTFGLTQEGSALIVKFDEMRTKGDSASAAIKAIGKDFDLSNVPGIRSAASVLDKLVAQGKISATEFQGAWADALKGQDLVVFGMRFKQGMDEIAREAEKAGDALKAAMARGLSDKELKVFEDKAREALAAAGNEAKRFEQVVGAQLQAAVQRTGLDMAVISGGMGKAAQSAINDTEVIIAGLDRLKVQGADTALALATSIGKGIDTADSQAAIEAVRLQVEAVRKTLGDKVADGLLDQAKQKSNELKDALDKATPGINSTAEAMKLLGVTSDSALRDIAVKSKAAFEALRDSGTASIRELQDGFKKYATDAIAANGGVATEALKVEAAMVKVSIQTDSTGKAIVSSMAQGAAAIKTVEDGYHQLGLKTPQELNKIAAANGAAWDKIKGDSAASLETLKAGFSTYAQSAIAAAGNVGSEQRRTTEALLKQEASVKGLAVSFDAEGKMVVQTQAEAAAAIDRTSGSLRGQRDAVDEVTAALERENAAIKRKNAAEEEAIALENKRLRRDKEGFSLDTGGNRIVERQESERSVYEAGKGQGLTDAQALQIASQFMQNGQKSGWSGSGAQDGENWGTALQKAIDALLMGNARQRAEEERSKANAVARPDSLDVNTRPVVSRTDAPAYPPQRETQPPPASAPVQVPVRAASVPAVEQQVGKSTTNLTINVAAGVSMSSRSDIERMARAIMPAINDLQRKGLRASG